LVMPGFAARRRLLTMKSRAFRPIGVMESIG
jgi:hypothetical protein